MKTENWTEKFILAHCFSYHKKIMTFCEAYNIPKNFESFLWYEHNGITSKTYRFLYTAPIYYLSNSKAFEKFYNSLAKDFRDDIASVATIKETQKYIVTSNKLAKALKKLMKDDSKCL
jgi:type IV secretory pathway VirJ component